MIRSARTQESGREEQLYVVLTGIITHFSSLLTASHRFLSLLVVFGEVLLTVTHHTVHYSS